MTDIDWTELVWDMLFADPRSTVLLEKLAKEAIGEQDKLC